MKNIQNYLILPTILQELVSEIEAKGYCEEKNNITLISKKNIELYQKDTGKDLKVLLDFVNGHQIDAFLVNYEAGAGEEFLKQLEQQRKMGLHAISGKFGNDVGDLS